MTARHDYVCDRCGATATATNKPSGFGAPIYSLPERWAHITTGGGLRVDVCNPCWTDHVRQMQAWLAMGETS